MNETYLLWIDSKDRGHQDIHKHNMSDLTDKMKRSFFQATVVSILLCGCTTWTLTKRMEKKLDGNYTRMLRAILNKSWRQHPTKQQLCGHLPPIKKSNKVRRTRHAGHCWRSRDELISDFLLWTPSHGRAKAGWPARTYIQRLCEDTGCSLEDLTEAMNDGEEWRERGLGYPCWWHDKMMMMILHVNMTSLCNVTSHDQIVECNTMAPGGKRGRTREMLVWCSLTTSYKVTPLLPTRENLFWLYTIS